MAAGAGLAVEDALYHQARCVPSPSSQIAAGNVARGAFTFLVTCGHVQECPRAGVRGVG